LGLGGSAHGLDNILKEQLVVTSLPLDFDFLWIDIDESDYWVLFDLLNGGKEFRPKIICDESNLSMLHDLIFNPARNDEIRLGASLPALLELTELHFKSYRVSPLWEKSDPDRRQV
jgi:hypothetical protein